MSSPNTDPLLTASKALLALLIGLVVFAIVLVGIGLAAVLTIQRGEITDKVMAAGLAPSAYWLVALGIAAVGVVLGLALRFLVELRAIVLSVNDGDPFVSENARRLTRMGWFTLAIQAIAIGLTSIAAYIASQSEVVLTDVSVSSSGLILALTLFVLARVFRAGTLMRDELEGTV